MGLERIEIPPKLTLAILGEVDFPQALLLPFLLTTRQSGDVVIEEVLEVLATRGIEEGLATVPSVDALAESNCLPFDAPEGVW